MPDNTIDPIDPLNSSDPEKDLFGLPTDPVDPPTGSGERFEFDTTPYNTYSSGSIVGNELFNNGKSDRDLIFEEAARGTMEEGFIDRDGNWESADKLDLSFGRNSDPDEEHQAARVTGFSEFMKPITDFFGIKDSHAQDLKNAHEEYFGWLPTSGTAQAMMFDSDGLVPVWSEDKRKFVLKQTSMNKDDVDKAEGRVMSAFGPREREKTWLGAMFQNFAEELVNTPVMAAGFAEAVSDTSEAVANYLSGDGFTASDDDFINKFADQLRQGKELKRIPEYYNRGLGTFSDPVTMFEGLGSGLASMVQFGGVGRIAAAGGKAVFGPLISQLAKASGKKGAQLAAETAFKKAHFANLFSSATGGMVINTGAVIEEAQENGLDNASAAAFALGVGALSTVIEMGIGTNRLNNWLIGSKGAGTREMMDAIARATGGDLTAESIEKVVRNQGVLERMAREIARKIPDGTVKNALKAGDDMAGAAKRSVAGRAVGAGIEEGSEEFFQSMVGSTGKWVYNNFVADEESTPGDGKFETQRLFSEESFSQALEEFAMGAILGGVMGGAAAGGTKIQENLAKKYKNFAHLNKSNKDIPSLIASGHTEDLLSIMQSLKDRGKYTDEQYRTYTRQVLEMDTLWKEHASDIIEAHKDPDLTEDDRRRHYSSAFMSVVNSMNARKMVDEAQVELSHLSTQPKTKDNLIKKSILEDKIRAGLAHIYAYDEAVKSYKDYRRAKYSEELREFEKSVNVDKGYAKVLFSELKEEIARDKEAKSGLKRNSDEYKKILERQKTKEATLKNLRARIMRHNSLLGDFKRKSYRQAFDSKMRAKDSTTLYVKDLANASLNPGYRYVHVTEKPYELRARGYKVVSAPFNEYMTDAPIDLENEPEEENRQDDTEEENTPTETKKGKSNEDTEESQEPPMGGSSSGTGSGSGVRKWNPTSEELEGAPKPGGITSLEELEGAPRIDENGNIIDDGPEEGGTPPPSPPKGSFGNPVVDDNLGDPPNINTNSGIVDDLPTGKDEANTKNPEPKKKPEPKKEPEPNKTEPKKIDDKNDVPITPQQIIPNQFGSILVSNFLDKNKIDDVLRNLDSAKDVRVVIGRKFRDKARHRIGDYIEKKNGKRVGVQASTTFADVLLYVDGVNIGALENPHKFTFDDIHGGEPIIFDELTFEEFSTHFARTDGKAVDLTLFENMKYEQRKLIELRKALDTLLGDKESLTLQDGIIPFKMIGQFEPLLRTSSDVRGKGKKVPYNLKDSDAKQKNGTFIIADTKRRNIITGWSRENPVKAPKYEEGRSRYQAYVHIGGVKTWIDITPARAFKEDEGDDYVKEINSLMNKVRRLDTKLDIKDPKVEELRDALNSKFIALEERGLFIKFSISKNRGKFKPGMVLVKGGESSEIIQYDNPTHFKSFSHMKWYLGKFSGLNVATENFRVSIPENVSGDNAAIAEMFNIFGDRKVLSPRVKVELHKISSREIIESAEKGADISNTPVTQDPVVEVVTDEEFNNFIDSGVVTDERLRGIAEKVKNRENLSQRETAIFVDKTSEINDIIAKGANLSGKGTNDGDTTIEYTHEGLLELLRKYGVNISEKMEKFQARAIRPFESDYDYSPYKSILTKEQFKELSNYAIRLKNGVKGTVSTSQEPVTEDAPAEPTGFTSLEDIDNSDLSDAEKFEAIQKFLEDSEGSSGIKFQRIPGLRVFNSTYITNLVTTNVLSDPSKPSSLEDAVKFYIDEYLRTLELPALELSGKNKAEDFRKMVLAAKEKKALSSLENQRIVINEVKKRISKFLLSTSEDPNEDPDIEENEDNEGDNTWDRSFNEAAVNIPSEVKKFIALLKVPGTDHYGRKTEVLVDFDRVYGKLLHNLSGTLDREFQEERLRVLASTDPEIAALKAGLDRAGTDSELYKGFFSTFTRFRVDYLKTVMKNGTMNVYNGIQHDAGDIMVRNWGKTYAAWNDKVSDEDREKTVDALSNALQVIREKDNSDLGIHEVVQAFSTIGIELPAIYVKGVLGDEDTRNAFPEKEWMEFEDAMYIMESAENGKDHRVKMFSEKGELGRLRKIADNAVEFSDDAFESTYMDAENKRRYAFVAPNYILSALTDLKTKGTNENTGKAPHNYLLREDNENVLKRMNISFVGDVEYGNRRKVFKNLEGKDFLLNRYGLFLHRMMNHDVNKAVYQPFVIAEKRSSYGVELPVDFGFSRNGKATTHAVDTYFETVFTGEYNRIKAIQADPEIGKNYNYKYSVAPFAFLTALNHDRKLIDAIIASKDISEVSAQAKKALRTLLNEVILETANEIDTLDGVEITSAMLEMFNQGKKKVPRSEGVMNMAGVFALNDMLVRASISELVQGDAAITKDEIDRVKRAAGMNAAGASVIDGPIKVVYTTDDNIEVDFSDVNMSPVYDEDGKEKKPESASDDAVVYVTAAYRKRMEETLGRLDSKKRELFDKLIRGEKLSPSEQSKLDLISAKTVYYTPEIYNKKSDMVLSRELTSIKIDGKWVAKTGMEELHNRLEFMEAHGVDQMITLNATKGVKNDAIDHNFFKKGKFDLNKGLPMIDKDGNKKSYSKEFLEQRSSGVKGEKDYIPPGYFETTMLDGKNERLQVENKSKSGKGIFDITHPSQGMELILAELRDMEGAPGVDKLKERFVKLRSEVQDHNVNIALKYLSRQDADGNLDIGDFITKALETLETAQEREEVLQYLQEEDGTFKYNMNLPHVQIALKKILVSHFNKGTLVDKMFGAKVTIIPSSGIEVVTDHEDNLQDPTDVADNPEKYYDKEKYTSRPLKLHGADEQGGTALAEVMITRQSAALHGLKPGDTIPPEALEIFGVRIPSQWYHSMVAAKVVGFLPDSMGDVMALPRELPLIAGEDFDVDSRFLMIKKGYWTTDSKGNRTYKLYGDAKTANGKWEEYFRHNSERKDISVSVKRSLDKDPEYLLALESLREHKSWIDSLYDRKSKTWKENQKWYEELQDLYDEFVEENKGMYITDFKKRIQEYQSFPLSQLKGTSRELKDTQENIDILKDRYESTKEYIAALRHRATLKAFKDYGLVTSEKELAESPNAINDAVHKNELISLYIEMFRHPSIQDRLKRPASVDRLLDASKYINGIFGNVDDSGNVKESGSMLISPVGMYNAWWNNIAGAANIAPVASTNIIVAFATQHGLKLSPKNVIKIDGENFGDFGVTRESDYINGEIVEDSDFKWDSISTLITAMTDNAKERLAAKLNLRKQFISPSTLMLGLGVGLNRTMLFMNQPVLREMDFGGRSYIDKESLISTVQSLQAAISTGMDRYDKGELKGKLDSVEFPPLTSERMEKGVEYNHVFGEESKYSDILINGPKTVEELDFLRTQLQVVYELASLVEIGKDAADLRNILNVKKGFKDTDTPSKISMSYGDLMNEERPHAFHNLREVLMKDPVIKSNMKAVSEIQDIWGRHLMSLSPMYRGFMDKNRNINAQRKEDFVDYLTMVAFNNVFKRAGINIADKAHLLYPSLEGETLYDMYDELYKKYDSFRTNPFVTSLIDGVTGKGKGEIKLLGVDTFNKSDDRINASIAEGFEELWKSDIMEEQEFAMNALFYLIQKDNFKFKSGSFINYISPDMITNTLNELDAIQEGFTREPLEPLNVFLGKSMYEVFLEFLENMAITNHKAFEITNIGRYSKAVISKTTDEDGNDTYVYSIEKLKAIDKDYIRTLNTDIMRIGTYSLYRTRLSVGADMNTLVLHREPIKRAPIRNQGTYHLTADEIYDLEKKIANVAVSVPNRMMDSIPLDLEAPPTGMFKGKSPTAPPTAPSPSMPSDFDIPSAPTGSIQDDFDISTAAPIGDVPSDFDVDLNDGAVQQIPDDFDDDTIWENSNSYGGIGLDGPKKQALPKNFRFDIAQNSIKSLLNSLENKSLTFSKVLEIINPSSEYKNLAKMMDDIGVEFNVISTDRRAFGLFHQYGKGVISLNKTTITEYEGDRLYDIKSLEDTLVHEMLHAVVHNLPKNKKDKMWEELSAFRKDLEKYVPAMSDRVKELFDWSEPVHHLDELVTYAFTDNEFAQFLNSIKIPGKTKGKTRTFWGRLKDIILARIPASIKNAGGKSKLDELHEILDSVMTFGGSDVGPFDMSVFDTGVKYQAAPSKPFNVASEDVALINKGKKTLSFRSPKNARNIAVGDTLNIVSGFKSTPLKVKVIGVQPVSDFADMPASKRDEMAAMMGDYKDYDDMLKKHTSNNSGVTVTPDFKEFILGKSEGVFVQYELENETAAQILERARKTNPAHEPYKKLLNDAQTEVQKQLDALEKSDTESNFKVARTARLNEIFSEINKTQDLLSIAEGALEDMSVNLASLETLAEKIENGTFNDPVRTLFLYYRLVRGYDFLDKIVDAKKTVLGNSELDDKDSLMKDLVKAHELKAEIESRFMEVVEPFIVKKLSGHAAKFAIKQLEEELEAAVKSRDEIIARDGISDDDRTKMLVKANARTAKLERLASRAAMDEDSIKALLNHVDRDIWFSEYLLGAASQSSDPIIALFSLHTKNAFEISRRDTINTANTLQAVYDKFKKDNKVGMSLSKIYGDLIEDRGDKLFFLSRYDEKRYEKDLNEYTSVKGVSAHKLKLKKELDALNAKPKLTQRQTERVSELEDILNDVIERKLERSLRKEFHEKNNRPLTDKEIKKKLTELDNKHGRDALIEWALDNMNGAGLIRWGLVSKEDIKNYPGKYASGEPKYYRELTTRVDKYLNSRWTELYNTDGTPKNSKGELHKALVDTYLEAQESLPSHERQGLMLPGMYKKAKDRVFEGQNILDVVKGEARELRDDLFGEGTPEDTQYGGSDLYGGVTHDIPVYYRNTLKAGDTSIDLVANILKYTDMVNTFKARSSVMETGMFLINKMEKRSVGVETPWFKKSMDSVAKRLNINIQEEKSPGDSVAKKRLEKFVEMVVFGQSSKEARVGNFRVDKAVSMLMAHASYSSFALPIDAMSRIFMGAASNFEQQLIQQLIEVVGDSDVDMDVFVQGQKLLNTRYGRDVFINDFQKDGMKSFMGQIIDKFDVIQGEFKDNLGNTISGSKLRNLMSRRTLYVHRNYSEVEPQIALFIGMMNKIKVKQGNEEISLLDAYELDSDGVLTLKSGVKWNTLDEIKLMNKMHGINKSLNGVYNSFDKPVIEQHWWGKALSFFRKYLYPSLVRRYHSGYIDYEMDTYNRGYAKSFLNATFRELYHYRKDVLSVIKGDGFSSREKMEAAQTLLSFGIGLGNMVIAGVLKMIIEATDDEDDVVLNYILYNAVRMQAETWSFWNPVEFMRILRSPTILTTYIERMTKLAAQLFDPFEEYERASGSNKKGDSKLYARFVKMLAGQTHYSANPDNAVRTFESLN